MFAMYFAKICFKCLTVQQTHMIKAFINFILSYFVFESGVSEVTPDNIPSNFYELSALNIDGQNVSFSEYKDRKAIIVMNVACQCGYTKSHYEGMMQLYRKYKKDGLEILAFPCNQFKQQEKGTNQEIQNFVVDRFQVTFPLFDKVDVNGPNAHPVYQFLKTKSSLYDPRKKTSKNIPWNFSKFLLNSRGKVVEFFPPTVEIEAVEESISKVLYGRAGQRKNTEEL